VSKRAQPSTPTLGDRALLMSMLSMAIGEVVMLAEFTILKRARPEKSPGNAASFGKSSKMFV
jgi:hypothetical protein